jgi:hypothetical protein
MHVSLELFPVSWTLGVDAVGINRVQLVLFGILNRTLGPYLADLNKMLNQQPQQPDEESLA